MEFDKIHPATSVVNRILNAVEELNAMAPQRMVRPQQPPVVPPTTEEQGQALDQKLQQPIGEMPPADDPQASQAARGVLSGETSLQGLIDG